jgi:hypothetical protein
MDQLVVEVALGVVISVMGYLLRRAIKSLDVTLQEIVQTIHGDAGLKGRVMVLEEIAADHEGKLVKVADALENMQEQFSKEAVKSAENFGEVKSDIREVLTRLEDIKARVS